MALHANVLIGDDVHLLVSSAYAGRVSKAMRQPNRRYVQAFHRPQGRTGTRWLNDSSLASSIQRSTCRRLLRYIEPAAAPTSA